jgi:NAD(P)-dependent dehydrogenase (short-subunit alcohol dehydrogenase family)
MQTVGYNSNKGAVISMTRDLATSWARHNITVNAIAPGWFPAPMSGGLIERFEERMLDGIPLISPWEPRHPRRVERGRRLPRLAGRSLHHRPDHSPGRWRHGLVAAGSRSSGLEAGL